MEVCKFCSFEKNGDLPEDHDIIEDDFSMKFSGTYKLTGEDHEITCRMPVEKDADISVYIDRENNLCAYFSTDYETEDEFYWHESKHKINFCPFCGRDLRKGMIFRE